jgi:hypothetical protein
MWKRTTDLHQGHDWAWKAWLAPRTLLGLLHIGLKDFVSPLEVTLWSG